MSQFNRNRKRLNCNSMWMLTLIILATGSWSGCDSATQSNVVDSPKEGSVTQLDPETPPPAPPTSEEIHQVLIDLVKSPDRETYLSIRSSLVKSDYYDPYSREVNTANQLFNQQRNNEAKQVLTDSLPNLLLSPRAHNLLGMILAEADQIKEAQIEFLFRVACLDGLMSTGDGSRENPFLVLRTSDEHDLLDHLKKKFESQSLIQEEDRYLDRIRCVDGSELWFDISDAYNRLSQQMGG